MSLKVQSVHELQAVTTTTMRKGRDFSRHKKHASRIIHIEEGSKAQTQTICQVQTRLR